MPAIIQLDWNGRTSYDTNDVITVHPVRWEFGDQELLAGSLTRDKVFAYVYCTDIVPDGPRARALVEVNEADPLDPATGTFRKRRFGITLTEFGGNVTRFATHAPWGTDGSAVPNNLKYSWLQLIATSRDKRPGGGEVPVGG